MAASPVRASHLIALADQRKAGAEGLEQRAALFELMKTVVLLPAYLRAKVTLIEHESKPTKLSQVAAASSKAQKDVQRVPEEDRVVMAWRVHNLRVLQDRMQ